MCSAESWDLANNSPAEDDFSAPTFTQADRSNNNDGSQEKSSVARVASISFCTKENEAKARLEETVCENTEQLSGMNETKARLLTSLEEIVSVSESTDQSSGMNEDEEKSDILAIHHVDQEVSLSESSQHLEENVNNPDIHNSAMQLSSHQNQTGEEDDSTGLEYKEVDGFETKTTETAQEESDQDYPPDDYKPISAFETGKEHPPEDCICNQTSALGTVTGIDNASLQKPCPPDDSVQLPIQGVLETSTASRNPIYQEEESCLEYNKQSDSIQDIACGVLETRTCPDCLTSQKDQVLDNRLVSLSGLSSDENNKKSIFNNIGASALPQNSECFQQKDNVLMEISSSKLQTSAALLKEELKDSVNLSQCEWHPPSSNSLSLHAAQSDAEFKVPEERDLGTMVNSGVNELDSSRKQEGKLTSITLDMMKGSSSCVKELSVGDVTAFALKRSSVLHFDFEEELDTELYPPSQEVLPTLLTVAARYPQNGLKEINTGNAELCKAFEQQLVQLQNAALQQEKQIKRLEEEKARQRQVSQEVLNERDKLKNELEALRDRNSDDLYLPQIKELEYTIAKQQADIRQLKEKLMTHDGAAKRAIATLQSEMKARIEQITKAYEECAREKDNMVVKFAEAETKNMEAKQNCSKLEAKIRDLVKEKEFMSNKMKAAITEKQKAVSDLESKVGEISALKKESDKMKEDMSSADYRIKWFQNKLKAELDAHKETKSHLEKTTVKLKEAKEETEQIRRDCQAIVKTYQESEEVRSNSLDKELKMKETELRIQLKERSDTEEIRLQTKRELDSLKAQYKDALAELTTLRDKIVCLEDERLKQEETQSKYESIIQNQKSDNTDLHKQLSDYRMLQENFSRAQDMIKTLDHEISELKIANRDLQKDAEDCQARESKMLSLQSELSRTNALLRSENTTFNNQVVNLNSEIHKMKMDIQDLETRLKDACDKYEEEDFKRKEETTTLKTQLTFKTNECQELRQKWEDEIDNSRTLKRKHASNVKDLTRQLQHAKKRLEAFESGERDATSMGSRTNSNGSLNSIDNSSNQLSHPAGHYGQPSAYLRRSSQEPEYPVITEQVEVDSQLLIERIVKLQKNLARKNEKVEFLQEHIQQLVADIKNKNKLIQGYVVREEAGILSSEVMDANKALLARKGGIMASVYNVQQQDGAMTLELSLEINKKLQAVLEDTLLKNMTLKENIDTLGAEIARLSQENRRLQLHLQTIGQC